jgi:crossover junction endonuclease MUS81
MTVELVIDTRENKIINLLQNNINITIEQLDLGDIVFRQDGKIVFIIERKTLADLKASICDGRSREQKMRLLGSEIPCNRILYLIEGNINSSTTRKQLRGFPITTLIGSLINTQLRDNIKVYKTESLQETVQFITRLYKKFNKEIDMKTYFNDKKSISDIEYCSSLKKRKKSNMSPRVWFISQLSLIPQVSEKIAEQIVIKYTSIYQLIKSYDSIEKEDDKKSLLANITYPIKNNKTRRIGGKISSRIYTYISNKI